MRIHQYLLASFLILLNGTCVSAQTAGTGGIGDPSAAAGSPASSYALNGLDHVNYYSGALNTEIPVLTIGGRGSASRAITIPIQRQWSVSNASGSYAPETTQWPLLRGLYTSGYISLESVTGSSWACYSNGQWQASGPFVTYVVWTGFDGTQTILKDSKSNGQEQGAGVNSCDTLASYAQYNRGKVFTSSDGSGLTFISDNDVIDQVAQTLSGTLLSRDGTKLRFSRDGYVSQIEDRNGNQILISWQSTANGGIFSFSDPLGRTESINYTEDVNTDTQDVITYPGYNNTSRTIKVNYSSLQTAATESLQTYHCLFPELNGASSSTQFNPWVISSIQLADGSQYSMKYNAYGELAQLTLPTGGIYKYSYWEAGCSTNGGASGVITLDNNSGYRIMRPLRERDEYADGVNFRLNWF